MAKTQKEIERALEMPEMGNLVESSTEAAPATPSTLPEPVQQPEVNVPLPEPPSPVSEKDFAPVEAPPKKQAGGGG